MYIIKILENEKEVARQEKFDVCVSTTRYEILIERVFRREQNTREKKSKESAEIAVRSVSTLNINPASSPTRAFSIPRGISPV